MTKIEVCDSATGQPLPSFDDGTTKVVCQPADDTSGHRSYLSVVAEQPSELQVESHGHSITSCPVRETPTAIPLAEILQALARPSSAPALLSFMHRSGDRPRTRDKEFTVTIRNDAGGPTSTVAATYTFRLMPPSQFAAAHSAHLAQVAPKRPGDRHCDFVVDWQLLPPTRCFNCQATINGSNCCPNCHAEQTEE